MENISFRPTKQPAQDLLLSGVMSSQVHHALQWDSPIPVGFIHFAAQTYDPDMLRLFDTMAAERTDRYKSPAVFGGFRGPLGRSYKRVEVRVDPALLACPSQLGWR